MGRKKGRINEPKIPPPVRNRSKMRTASGNRYGSRYSVVGQNGTCPPLFPIAVVLQRWHSLRPTTTYQRVRLTILVGTAYNMDDGALNGRPHACFARLNCALHSEILCHLRCWRPTARFVPKQIPTWSNSAFFSFVSFRFWLPPFYCRSFFAAFIRGWSTKQVLESSVFLFGPRLRFFWSTSMAP